MTAWFWPKILNANPPIRESGLGGNMPNEVWYVLIVAVLIAIVIAILKGSGIILRKGEDGVEIEVKERSSIPQKPRIVVGEGVTIEDAEIGDIGGIIHKGSGT